MRACSSSSSPLPPRPPGAYSPLDSRVVSRESWAASVKDRRQPKTPEEAASELVAYRKQIQHCREIESRSDAGPRTRRFYDELCTTSRVSHVLTHLTVLLSCFWQKQSTRVRAFWAFLRASRNDRHLPRIDPIFPCALRCSRFSPLALISLSSLASRIASFRAFSSIETSSRGESFEKPY